MKGVIKIIMKHFTITIFSKKENYSKEESINDFDDSDIYDVNIGNYDDMINTENTLDTIYGLASSLAKLAKYRFNRIAIISSNFNSYLQNDSYKNRLELVYELDNMLDMLTKDLYESTLIATTIKNDITHDIERDSIISLFENQGFIELENKLHNTSIYHNAMLYINSMGSNLIHDNMQPNQYF